MELNEILATLRKFFFKKKRGLTEIYKTLLEYSNQLYKTSNERKGLHFELFHLYRVFRKKKKIFLSVTVSFSSSHYKHYFRRSIEMKHDNNNTQRERAKEKEKEREKK